MEEKEWMLGEGLVEKDDILESITFEELITTLYASCEDIDEKSIRKMMESIVEARVFDAMFLLNKNMEEIIARALGRHAEDAE